MTMLRGLVAVLLLAGCGAPGSLALPTAPPVPDGWTVTNKAGISVAAPAEWGGDIFGGDIPVAPWSILITSMVDPPSNGVSVWAIGPRGERQPDTATDAALVDWLLDATGEEPSSYSRAVVALPSGRAVAVRATYYAGRPEETLVVSYAIPTAIGVAFLQIIVDADLLDRYEAALPTIAARFWFRVST